MDNEEISQLIPCILMLMLLVIRLFYDNLLWAMFTFSFYNSLQHSFNYKLVKQDNETIALSTISIIEIGSIHIFYVNT